MIALLNQRECAVLPQGKLSSCFKQHKAIEEKHFEYGESTCSGLNGVLKRCQVLIFGTVLPYMYITGFASVVKDSDMRLY